MSRPRARARVHQEAPIQAAPPWVCPTCARIVYDQPMCPFDGARLQRATDPRVGLVVGSYRLHGRLGTGGMGTVYRGEHRLIGRDVAIKVLHQEAAEIRQVVERFLMEARACSLIRHPNVVDVTDFGTLPDGAPFLVMELIEGTSLCREIEEKGPLPLHRVVSIVRQICSALHACHAQGVAHRDLKPENVVLVRQLPDGLDPLQIVDPVARLVARRDGAWDAVKVLDFGIARVNEQTDLLDAETRRDGLVFGSPCFLSPEQAMGLGGDHRSDIYSRGVILFEMLTGDVPFGGADAGTVMRQHLEAPVPRIRAQAGLAHLPARLDAVVARAMAKEPGDRFPDVVTFHRELTMCLLEAGYGPELEERPARPPRMRTRVMGSGQDAFAVMQQAERVRLEADLRGLFAGHTEALRPVTTGALLEPAQPDDAVGAERPDTRARRSELLGLFG